MKLTHFGLRVSTHVGLHILRQFGIENHKQKISNIHKDFLNYINVSWIIPYAKLSQNPCLTYYPNNLQLD